MEIVECLKCRTAYHRTEHALKEPEQDEFRCVNCNELVERWNAIRYPTFVQVGAASARRELD